MPAADRAPSPAALRLALAIEALLEERLAALADALPAPSPEEADPELTEAEAAAYLRLSPKTLRKWRSTRSNGPAYVKHGDPTGNGPVGYRRSALRAYEEACTRRHPHEVRA